MRIDLIAFTARGLALAQRIAVALGGQGHEAAAAQGFGAGKASLADWTCRGFEAADALIFVGAAGIAVRAVAPFVKSKLTDPAVLVLDEGGRFCISLLSGHVGGANALCVQVADIAGALPVVTTATDASNVFAVDTWATQCGLHIAQPQRIKNVSGKLLRGKELAFFTPFVVGGALPGRVRAGSGHCDFAVDVFDVHASALLLVPRIAVLGIGCRKNTPQEAIETAVQAFMAQNHVHPAAICGVASIDLKAQEAGLLRFCSAHEYPFTTFSADELRGIQGCFSASAFVQGVTGVDNVCERSAVRAAGGGLVLSKQVHGGVTLALAIKKYTVNFKEKVI